MSRTFPLPVRTMTDAELDSQLDRIDEEIAYTRKRLTKLDRAHKLVWGEQIRRMKANYERRQHGK